MNNPLKPADNSRRTFLKADGDTALAARLAFMMPIYRVVNTDLKGEVVRSKQRKDLAASHKIRRPKAA